MDKVTKTLFLVVLLACIFALNTYAAVPTEIYTADQLNDVRNNLAGSYILMSDIDLSDTVWGEVYADQYGTSGWEPIGSQVSPFGGNFDGNGHSISGLFIDLPNTSKVGLFGYVNLSNICDLGLENVNITGKIDVGGLTGYNGGTITNSYVTGSVEATYYDVGGLAGCNRGTITNSYAAGTVLCPKSDGGMAGGLVGDNFSGTITNSYATSVVTGANSAIGGLAGRNANGYVNNSYATGNVTGKSSVGGLVGYCTLDDLDDAVINSYATGAVTGTINVGGLIGQKDAESTVLSSYYNTCTSGQSDDSGKGEPYTSTEMVQAAAYIDWDFAGTWNINEWESYPHLQWSSHVPAPPAATEVTVSSAVVELTYGGESTTLTATVLPECAIQTVTWSTNDPEVATVDENGVVTPIGAGEAKITATPVSGDVFVETAVTVWKKELTVSGTFTAENKVYDGSTTAVIDASSLTLSGVVDGDNVELNTSAVFADKNAADGITVNLTSDNSLTGADAGNYTLSLTGAPTSTANITVKELTVINAEAQDKVYDGAADADIINAELSGVVGSDEVTLGNNTIGTFAQATVGTGIGVTTNMTITGVDADNYTIAQPVLSADITAKELTVGGTFTADNKIYDGNTTAVINASGLILTGVVDGDSVTLNAAAAFTDANVADNITVNLTDASSLSGEDSDNYSLSLAGAPTTTANITPPPSDSKAITNFSLEAFEPDIQAVIDEGAKTITMEVPFGTDITALVPTIEHTGADIVPASGIVQDFTNPVTYEVTAEDNTTAVYTVTMSVALPSNEARLTNLVISSGTLNPVFVPDIQVYTADVANSAANITVTPTAAHPGASIEVNMAAVDSGEASQTIALNVGANTINIKVTAEDGTEIIYEVTVNRASSGDGSGSGSDRDRDSDRNTSASEPEPATASNITINVNGNSITSAASVDSGTGTVTAVLDESDINNALTEPRTDGQKVNTIDIEIPKVTGANYYVTELPATVLTGDNATRIEIISELGTITLPGNMLGNEGAYATDNVGLSIGTVDKLAIDEKVRTQIGDKPVIELKLKSKEGTISWNNPDAPVTVSIPYTPTEKELSDPEHITVWYIDGECNVIEVPSGRYNPVTGMVTFSTAHFSNYAVVYVKKTFSDLKNVTWAKKQIEVLASKGIIKGVSENKFEPQSNVTRADFLYSLIRTLGVVAKHDSNFDDISKDDYYYKEIGIAQRMGITKGTGNNKFSPEISISRQDMMVLTERALRMLKMIESEGNASDLDKFADKSLVADYAVDSVASVVKEGLIVGSGDGVNPLGNTTRAESAVFLYRIYNRQPISLSNEPIQ